MNPKRTRQPTGGKLRQALEEARGQSEFVIVVVADIRGFSAFSQQHESPDVAMYIKRVYMRLIDEYFPGARFYKATGDGLLMTFPYDERHLQDKVQTAVQSCLRCLDGFAAICSGDPMVNFPTPDKIGFGIARGTACCLLSRRTILDYSGHLLNLATRLMDLARPSGIVLDGGVELGLLDDDTAQLFEPHQVYIRSVAETQPRGVYVLKDSVGIPEQAKRPIAVEQWEMLEVSNTVRQWKALAGPKYWRQVLPKALKRPDGIMVEMRHPIVGRSKAAARFTAWTLFRQYDVALVGNEHCVTFDMSEIVKYATSQKLPQNSTLTLRISYVPE